jgi:hypothetical protein
MDAVPAERDEHLADFLRVAGLHARDDLARWHATLEEIDVTDGPYGTAYAIAIVAFRSRHYRYRRRVWPAPHPAPLQAALYVTTLVERLLTSRSPADPHTSVVTL